MSDSTQSGTPTSTKTIPNFGPQVSTLMKMEAADPALVEKVASFLESRAAEPALSTGRSAPSASQPSQDTVDTAPSSRVNNAAPAMASPPGGDSPKVAQASAEPEPTKVVRPGPDALSTAPATPVEGGPKLEQPAAHAELPLTAGTDRAEPKPGATPPTAAVDGDRKAGRATASAEQPTPATGLERPVPETAAAKPAAAIAGTPKADQPPSANNEPPPHPGPDAAKVAGPQRLAVETPASTPPERQPRKPKAEPVAAKAERPADPRPDQAKAAPEASAPAQKEASQQGPKPDATVSPAGQDKVHSVRSPGSGAAEPPAQTVAADAKPQAAVAIVSNGGRAAAGVVSSQAAAAPEAAVAAQASSAIGSILSARRQPALSAAPWKVPAPAIGARIAQHELRVADNKTARLVTHAEKSGAAMEASLDRFMSGPGRGVMKDLQTAAASDPGGMPAVIAGMKPGGTYAAERVAFDTAMKNPAVGADYSAMADSAQRHTKDRYAVENNLHQRGLDPAVLGERFTKKDAELGEKAASIPGREAGKNALEEMAQKLAELLRTAMERVGQAFGRTASADVQATARPSPSPSPS